MPHDQSALTAAIRASGRRLTTQRAQVLEALHDLPGHSTVEQIHAGIRKRGGADVALSTVYRNLDALVEMALVAAFTGAGGVTTYEWTAEAHHHLLCDGCGHTQEVALRSLDTLAREVRRDHGFVADMRHLAIHGRCVGCRDAEASS